MTTTVKLKPTATVLTVCSLFSLLLISLHPTVSTTHMADKITEITQESHVNSMVHGLLIVCTLLFNACLSHGFSVIFTTRLLHHLARSLFLFGTFCMAGAALVNGFIFPDTIMHLDKPLALDPALFNVISSLTWNANQSLASASVFSWLFAIASWSAIIYSNKLIDKLTSLFGLCISAILITALASKQISLDLFGMTTILLFYSLWFVAAAAYFWRQNPR